MTSEISKRMALKTVTVVGHTFDCLPGHVQITSRGSGADVRVAVCSALRLLMKDSKLCRKRVHSFKLSVIVEKGG